MVSDVTVKVSLAKIVKKLGFGYPLIFDGFAEQDVPYTECADLDEVSELFDETSNVYQAAKLLFMQEDSPAKIAVCATTKKFSEDIPEIYDKEWRQLIVTSVGKTKQIPGEPIPAVPAVPAEASATVQEHEILIQNTAGAIANGVVVKLTAGTGESKAEWTGNKEITVTLKNTETAVTGEQIEDLLNASTAAVGVTPVSGVSGNFAVTIGGDENSATIDASQSTVGVVFTELADGVAAIPEQPTTTTEYEDDIKTIAEYMEAKGNKKYWASVSNTENPLTGYDRTNVIYYNIPGDVKFPEAAVLGAVAGKKVGSFTVKNQIIKGLKPMTDRTEYRAADTCNYICILEKAGDIVTSEGKAVSGEYIDIVDAKDWIIMQIEYQSQKALNNNDKLPYDNNGIAVLENICINVLQEAYNNGMIAVSDDGVPLFSTNYGSRSESTVTDRAERRYTLGRFHFTLAGAIHLVEISGVIEI